MLLYIYTARATWLIQFQKQNRVWNTENPITDPAHTLSIDILSFFLLTNAFQWRIRKTDAMLLKPQNSHEIEIKVGTLFASFWYVIDDGGPELIKLFFFECWFSILTSVGRFFFDKIACIPIISTIWFTIYSPPIAIRESLRQPLSYRWRTHSHSKCFPWFKSWSFIELL